MADREKKRGRQRYKNLNISRKNSFLDEMKSIFHSFLKDYQKIADISFKEKCNNFLVEYPRQMYIHKQAHTRHT